MKKIIFFTSILLPFICNGQIDYQHHSELLLNAHRAFSNKSYEKALKHYENAFEIREANSAAQYLNAAICAAKQNNKKRCEQWVSASVSTKNVSIKTINKFSEDPIYQEIAKIIITNYDSLTNAYFKNMKNLSVYFQVTELVNRDQFARTLKDYYLGITKEDSEAAFDGYMKAQKTNDTSALKKYKTILWPEVSETFQNHQNSIVQHTDSLNLVTFIKITEIHGWQQEGHIILWHQRGNYGENNWIWNYFKPLINKGIENGIIEPYFWAMFEDFKSIREHGKTIYGYHPGKVDKDTVNINRKSIGLPALTDNEIKERNDNPYGGRLF